jgi:undecaprenyl-diphosphatase
MENLARMTWNPSVWSFVCLVAGFVLLSRTPDFPVFAVLLFLACCVFSTIAIANGPLLTGAVTMTAGVLGALRAIQSGFDSTVLLFLNRFVGKSATLDRSVELFSDAFIFHGILFVAVLWFIWFNHRQQETRIRLILGAMTAVFAGLLSRLLQLCLPFHLRPLFATDLNLTFPIDGGSGLSHWNSFPSDHASLFFGLATLIWLNDRRLGVWALFWAAIMSSTRIYLGLHYPTDILGGAALGFCLVMVSQSLPSFRAISWLLEWERCAPASFYAVAFIASYQAGTLFNDVRAIAKLIGPWLLRHVS